MKKKKEKMMRNKDKYTSTPFQSCLFAVVFFATHSLFAQQWIDKNYSYDSIYNVSYGFATAFDGGTDTLKMDIFVPVCDSSAHNKRPLAIFIHGGAFLVGDKSDVSIVNLCKQFAKRGYVTASINYRLGFISDDMVWNCNYPNYECVFSTDTAEWCRAYYRGVQDGKGALRYLINRYALYDIDTSSVFVSGESAGAFIALGVGLLDTIIEKPAAAYSISDAPLPSNNSTNCSYNSNANFSGNSIVRPDLGSIDGMIEPTTIHYTIKGIGNMYGGVFSDILKYSVWGSTRPAIYSFHQPCDLIVPIDSGKIYSGMSWCMTNGYNCYGIANTPKVYGSRSISQWNSENNYGYSIHDEFTTTNFPYSFLIGTASCADQVNNPCHGYDNAANRENNMATFFASLVSTNPFCALLSDSNIGEVVSEKGGLPYPNPTDGVFWIKLPQLHFCNVEIYNLLGEKVYCEILRNGKNQICLPEKIPEGMYLLKLNQESLREYQHLIYRKY